TSLSKELIEIGRAIAICALALLVAGQIGHWPTISLRTITGFTFISFAVISSVRLALRYNLRRFRERGHDLQSLVNVCARMRAQSVDFDGVPIVTLGSVPPFSWRTEAKRIMDLAVSITFLFISAPLFALVAIAIKLDSRGPIFFVQERVGFSKRRFRMIKFRTMTSDAEDRMKEIEHLNEKSGPIFKIRNDPRITRVGRWLRKTSIDELPQLVNVLLADMSIVGPRPLSVRDATRMEEVWQKRRFSVKPGLTCLWQVSGRSNLSF